MALTSMAANTRGKLSPWIAVLPLLVLPALAISFRIRVPAWLFMWALSFAIFAGLKWMTWWKARMRVPHSAARSLAYLVARPGMDAETFLDADRHPIKPIAQDWLWATFKAGVGVAVLWMVARRVPEQ